MAEADEFLLTVLEAAERARVNPETIRRWIKSGRLPAAKPAGGPYRIHSTDLERLLGAQELPKPVPKAPASPSPDEPADEERRAGGSPEERRAYKYLSVLGRIFDDVVSGTEDAAKRQDLGPGFLEFVESILESAYDEVTGELLPMLDVGVEPSEEDWLRTIEKDLDRLRAVDYKIYKSAEEAEEDAKKRDELRRRREDRAADRAARREWRHHIFGDELG